MISSISDVGNRSMSAADDRLPEEAEDELVRRREAIEVSGWGAPVPFRPAAQCLFLGLPRR